jgi:hypothetical protein
MSATRSNNPNNVTIRWATPADRPALERVAGLDSKHVPTGPLLIAEVDGRVWAALSTHDDTAVADPFVPSGSLVTLLATRASQLRKSRRTTYAPEPISLRAERRVAG